MRILVVSPYLPEPPRAGGPVRLRGLVRGLARSHSVSLLAFVPAGRDDRSAIASSRRYCVDVVTVPNERLGLEETAKRSLQLRSLFSRHSYEYMVHRRAPLQAELDGMLERSPYDLIQIVGCNMAKHSYPPDVPLVLDEQNIEYDILRRTAALEPFVPRNLYGAIDALKLRTEEEDAWRRADACSLVSARDEAIVRRSLPGAQTAVVPNGADTDFFSPRINRPGRRDTLLFFGVADYYPNTDGLLFFLHEVLPLLKRRYPSLQLLIVGKSPPPAIRRWASTDVIVTGQVEDVRPYIERARAVVVPLRIGGGTRLKVLEAMAMAKPVISTTLGAEGLAVADGDNIMLGDTPDEFATQVGRVLDDDDLAERLGTAARRLVEANYDWRISVRRLEALHADVLRQPGDAPRPVFPEPVATVGDRPEAVPAGAAAPQP